MSDRPRVRGIVPYVFCTDAGAVADWCVRVLGFEERGRWSDDGVVVNVELVADGNEVWLDGGVDWKQRWGDLGSWLGFWVDDVDAAYEYVRGQDPNVDMRPPADRDFGIRMLTVTDPEGHEWGFMRRI